MLGDKPYFFGSKPHTLGNSHGHGHMKVGDKEQITEVQNFRLRGVRSFVAVRIHSDGLSATDLHEGQLREPLEVLGQNARRAMAGLGGNVHEVQYGSSMY